MATLRHLVFLSLPCRVGGELSGPGHGTVSSQGLPEPSAVLVFSRAGQKPRSHDCYSQTAFPARKDVRVPAGQQRRGDSVTVCLGTLPAPRIRSPSKIALGFTCVG